MFYMMICQYNNITDETGFRLFYDDKTYSLTNYVLKEVHLSLLDSKVKAIKKILTT
jgi:hypothetical protein